MPASSKFSICVFAKAMAAHRGGNFLWPFTIVARELVNLGHTVTVITTAHPDGKTPMVIEDGAEIHYLHGTRPEKTGRTFWKASAERFDELHETRRFDIVMGRGRSPWGFLAFSRYKGEVPLVCHEGTYPARLHALLTANAPMMRLVKRPAMLLDALANPVHTRCLTGSQLIVCNSDALARGMKEAFWWRQINTVSVPYGFDPSGYETASKQGVDLDESALARLGSAPAAALLRSGRRYVVFTGRLTRLKGALDLVRALHASRHRDFSMLVLGGANTANRRRVARLAEKLGVSERLVLAGPVPHDGLPLLLARAEAFLFPSLHPESLPKAVMEAMAAALPVIAYRIPATASLIEAGADGLLADPGDVGSLTRHLDKVLEDRLLACRLAMAARQKIEDRFSRHHTAQLWSDALALALGNGSRAAGSRRTDLAGAA